MCCIWFLFVLKFILAYVYIFHRIEVNYFWYLILLLIVFVVIIWISSCAESLCTRVGIRGKPKVIDLTPKQRTASRLTETRLVFNTVEDKDLNLFCFLKEHAGRTIVFANSIDCVWRLMRLFTLLGMLPLRLFANMQQKQRLQNLEKFKGENLQQNQ